MLTNWHVWVDCRDERKSRKVLARVAEAIGRTPLNVTVVPWDTEDTSGHKINFAVDLENARWNDAVVEVITLGLRISHWWTISGGTSVREHFSAYAKKLDVFKIAGIEGAEWNIERTDPT